MYTLNRDPIIVESVYTVNDPESDYYGQEIAQILCQGERDWLPLNELTEVKPANPANRRSNVRPCHYCGMDARHTGFFGEPVCDECR